jgi:hypothetical protein
MRNVSLLVRVVAPNIRTQNRKRHGSSWCPVVALPRADILGVYERIHLPQLRVGSVARVSSRGGPWRPQGAVFPEYVGELVVGYKGKEIAEEDFGPP